MSPATRNGIPSVCIQTDHVVLVLLRGCFDGRASRRRHKDCGGRNDSRVLVASCAVGVQIYPALGIRVAFIPASALGFGAIIHLDYDSSRQLQYDLE